MADFSSGTGGSAGTEIQTVDPTEAENDEAEATEDNALAVGDGSVASGTAATVLGASSEATNNGSTALGSSSLATESFALALGPSAEALANSAIAIGAGVTVDNADTVSLNDLLIQSEDSFKATIFNGDDDEGKQYEITINGDGGDGKINLETED